MVRSEIQKNNEIRDLLMRFDHQFFRAVIPDVQFLGCIMPDISGFNVDSRTIQKGEVFVAIKGNNFDGHDYINQAIARGASGIMLDKSRQSLVQHLDAKIIENLWIVLVNGVAESLIKLATVWRSQFNYPIIGITGSIGKTSTKEIISNILKVNGNNFIASRGNQNTALGISLNILRMRENHTMAIFEMGISKRGEMSRMAEIVRPTIAIITTIGHSHMEGLGSLQDIATEKRDIFKFFKEDNIGIVNGDLAMLTGISYKHPIVKFGSKTINHVQARKIQTDTSKSQFILKLYKERYPISLSTNHSGRIYNVLAAAAAAYLLGVPHAMIVQGIQQPIEIAGRFQETRIASNKGTLINDCYNASPESMKAALLAFEKVASKGKKIAVLGDMLELGVNSPFWHRQLGRILRKVPSLNHVILVGDLVKWTKVTMPVTLSYEHVPTWQAAVSCLENKLDSEAVLLVKGSLGVGLTNLVTAFTEKQ